MIGTLAVAAALLTAGAPAQEQPNKVSAAAVVGKMFERYDPAKVKSLAGNVRLTQSAANVSITIDSRLYFERPSKLFLHQTRKSSEPREWYVTSDGKLFTYEPPESAGSFRPPRLVERVAQKPKELLKIGDQQSGLVYSVGEMYSAAALSIGDRSPVLDVAFGNLGDWKYLKGQWKTLVYRGKVKIREQDAHAVSGEWYENPTMRDKMGEFEIYVTDAGDLLRYVHKQNFGLPDGSGLVTVVSIWDADLKVNTAVDPSVFRLVR